MALRAPTGPGVGRLGDAGPTDAAKQTADNGDSGGNFGAKLEHLARFLLGLGGMDGWVGAWGPRVSGGSDGEWVLGVYCYGNRSRLGVVVTSGHC